MISERYKTKDRYWRGKGNKVTHAFVNQEIKEPKATVTIQKVVEGGEVDKDKVFTIKMSPSNQAEQKSQLKQNNYAKRWK